MNGWKAFATDILGMQIIERADDGTVYLRMDENHHRIALHPSGEMVFLHCNPRHHSIAFQPSIKDLPRSRDKKMWHFMLETNTLDDVGTALDLANRAGGRRRTTRTAWTWSAPGGPWWTRSSCAQVSSRFAPHG